MNLLKKKLPALSALWFVLIFSRILFHHDIFAFVSFMVFFLDLALIASGSALFILTLYLLVFGDNVTSTWLITLIFVPTLLLATYLSSVPFYASAYFKLLRNEPAYALEVRRILSAPKGSAFQCSRHIIVDEGPPRRIAFPWVGFVSKWAGAVYDPTGFVLTANDVRRVASADRDSTAHYVVNLFGGRLTSATHLWGNWYYCYFH